MTDDEELDCSVSPTWRWQPVNREIVVWLTEWRTYGFLLHEGIYVSTVSFTNPHTGERLIEQIESDEFEYWEDRAIEYDED